MTGKVISNDKNRSFSGTQPARVPVCKVIKTVLLALLLLAGPVASFPTGGDQAKKDEMKSYSDDFARREQARLEFEKGKLYFEDESYDLARRHLQAVLKVDREHLGARYYLALVENRCGEHKLAIEHFTAIYNKEPHYKELSFEMAVSHLELKQCDEARTWLERYLKKNPKSKKALKLRGKIKDCLKKQEKTGGQQQQL